MYDMHMWEFPQPQQKSAPTREFEDIGARITDTSMVPGKWFFNICKIQAWKPLYLLDPNFLVVLFMAP
jgi:hypothetical protein